MMKGYWALGANVDSSTLQAPEAPAHSSTLTAQAVFPRSNGRALSIELVVVLGSRALGLGYPEPQTPGT